LVSSLFGTKSKKTTTPLELKSLAPPTKTEKAEPAKKLSSQKGLSLDDIAGLNEKPFLGDPNNQVLVFDCDETWEAADKKKITDEVNKNIKELGKQDGRKLVTISKKDPDNVLGVQVQYVVRPGTKELFEYLKARGYKIVLSSRNYRAKAETILKREKDLAKLVDGVLGREDLLNDLNKDFKQFPNHPDNLNAIKRAKQKMQDIVYFPKYCVKWCAAKFTGDNCRWTPQSGVLGKYPPNMIELLKANGNHKLEGCRPPRILIDNSKREKRDSKLSSDWAWVNPNYALEKGKDGKLHYATFEVDRKEAMVDLVDPETGEKKKSYLWVKKVIEQIERGWEGQYRTMYKQEPKKIEAKSEPSSKIKSEKSKTEKQLAALAA